MRRQIKRGLLTSVTLIGLTAPAGAQCTSAYTDEVNRFEWTVHSDYRFDVCYDRRYEDDFQYALQWINHAYGVGASKYGITHPLAGVEELTIFLPPSETSRAKWWLATNFCCSGGVAEVHVLTASKYAAGRGEPIDSFAKVLVHEMMNILFYDIDPRHFRLPSWIREGLSEYEAWMTTPHNMALMTGGSSAALPQRVRRADIGFGWTAESLSGRDTTFLVSETYFAGAVVVIVLAEQFGEGFHRQLFESPINDALAGRGVRKWNVFKEIVFWLNRYGAPR